LKIGRQQVLDVKPFNSLATSGTCTDMFLDDSPLNRWRIAVGDRHCRDSDLFAVRL